MVRDFKGPDPSFEFRAEPLQQRNHKSTQSFDTRNTWVRIGHSVSSYGHYQIEECQWIYFGIFSEIKITDARISKAVSWLVVATYIRMTQRSISKITWDHQKTAAKSTGPEKAQQFRVYKNRVKTETWQNHALEAAFAAQYQLDEFTHACMMGRTMLLELALRAHACITPTDRTLPGHIVDVVHVSQIVRLLWKGFAALSANEQLHIGRDAVRRGVLSEVVASVEALATHVALELLLAIAV